MNPTLVRLLPPGLVVTVAIWCGWPTNPSTFEDLPASAARAARWKASDLQVPQVACPTVDPFAAVLQPATQALPTAAIVEPPQEGPTPPTSAELLAYIQLEGFGTAGGRQWAVVNGRPRSVGDVVLPQGHFPWACQLAQIADDHVVIRCGPASIDIRRSQRGRRQASAAAASESGPLPTDGISPPPPPIIPDPRRHDLATGATS